MSLNRLLFVFIVYFFIINGSSFSSEKALTPEELLAGNILDLEGNLKRLEPKKVKKNVTKVAPISSY